MLLAVNARLVISMATYLAVFQSTSFLHWQYGKVNVQDCADTYNLRDTL